MQGRLLVALVATAALISVRDDAADRRVGLWMSQGYGLFFRIEPMQLLASEVTAVSCLPAWTAARSDDRDGAWIFRGGFASGDEIIRLAPNEERDRLVLRRSDDLAAMQLQRVRAAPGACATPQADSPRANFDVFWNTFAEHYPFFNLHGMDWNAVRRRFQPRVSEHTTDAELFEIFRQMLTPLADSHVVLDMFPPGTSRGKDWLKTPLQEVWLHKADLDPLDDDDLDRANEIIESRYMEGRVERYCGDRIRFGRLRGGRVGYLGVLSFHQYTPDDDLPAGLVCLRAAADTIFRRTGDLTGLVIDVRSNGGGEDAFVLELASRLTSRPYLAFNKQARLVAPGPVRFTPPEGLVVEPSSAPSYVGEAVILTGRHSASAAETFLMALMGRRPRIRRIGAATQGVFSDVLDRRLPNGWRLVLPNEVYATEDGRTFDVVGVPPDVVAPDFSTRAIAEGRDASLEEALAILGKRD